LAKFGKPHPGAHRRPKRGWQPPSAVRAHCTICPTADTSLRPARRLDASMGRALARSLAGRDAAWPGSRSADLLWVHPRSRRDSEAATVGGSRGRVVAMRPQQLHFGGEDDFRPAKRHARHSSWTISRHSPRNLKAAAIELLWTWCSSTEAEGSSRPTPFGNRVELTQQAGKAGADR